MKDLVKLFASFANLKVAVVGDVMLDTYVWGKVDRISPEAPVPIVTIDHQDFRIGGAGNVALNCRSLAAEVSLFSVTGDDDEAGELENLLKYNGIETKWMIRSPNRITTSKTRVISRNQQMMRLDSEITRDLDKADEDKVIERFEKYITQSKPDVVIFEDYNKGVLTENLISSLIQICNAKNIFTTVDPKRKNFFNYKGVTIFKPNLKEVREGLNMITDDLDEGRLQMVHQQLHEKLNHKISFITLSEKGVFYQQGERSAIIPSHIRNVADVSGAGDTVIAVASMAYAVSKDVHLMAELANIAGGLVCEEVGTVAVDAYKLLHEGELLLS